MRKGAKPKATEKQIEESESEKRSRMRGRGDTP